MFYMDFHTEWHDGTFSRVTLQGTATACTPTLCMCMCVFMYMCVPVCVCHCVCLLSPMVICQEIPISVWNNLVITASVVQSTYSFLLIWTLPRFKLAVITSPVVVLYTSPSCGGISLVPRAWRQRQKIEEEDEAEDETQPTDSFLPTIKSLS